MPHVIIKLAAGRSDQQKIRLAELVTQAVITGAACTEDQVSVSIEDVEPAGWVEQVYRPEIIGKRDLLFKKPGYDPL